MREFYTVELEEGREKYGEDFTNSKIMSGYHNSGVSAWTSPSLGVLHGLRVVGSMVASRVLLREPRLLEVCFAKRLPVLVDIVWTSPD